MPIEFQCGQCGELLRRGDDMAGQKTVCPGCGAILTVAPQEHLPEAGLSSSAAVNSSYRMPSDLDSAAMRPGSLPVDRVSLPAMGLTLTGGLGLVAQLVVIVFNLFALGDQPAVQHPMLANPGLNLAIAMIGVVVCGLVFYAGKSMKYLRNYGLSMTGAIIALVPCFSPCCFLGIPFGIWAIVVLLSPDVKAAFR